MSSSTSTSQTSPLPGRVGRANRTAFLVDGRAYFAALAAALRRASRSVIILGWDMDSRIRLFRGEREDGGDEESGPTLSGLLRRAVEENPELVVRILNWDYPMVYALGRQPLPRLNPDWNIGPRVVYRLDDQHPQGAAHHQKIVVVDDALAFVGGMDLTHGRWDTPDHFRDDPRRVTPRGDAYQPYHDVQMMVDGEAAALVGEAARSRWLWGTGEQLDPVEEPGRDPWPPSVEPCLGDTEVAVAQTLPAFKGREAVREIEPLYLEAIARARRTVYIENQYLTAGSVRDALAGRLDDPDGPEVCIVLPTLPTGLLEQVAMVPLQRDAVRRLEEADRHGRLRVYCPFGEKDGQAPVKIHSKVMIVDDGFVTVGSANLNHRSMGLDSECNLALRADGNNGSGQALARLRHDLMADHLGVDAGEVAAAEFATGSMNGVVEGLRHRRRRLLPYRESGGSLPLRIDAEQVRPLDPLRPLALDSTLDSFMDLEGTDKGSTGFLKLALVLAALVLLLLVWRYTPLADMVDGRHLLAWARGIRESALFLPGVLAAYLAGGMVMFPVTLLIITTAALMPPWQAFWTSLAGSLGSAALGYGLGMLLGRDLVARLLGRRLDPLKDRMKRHGLWAMALLRLVPVAPYTVVNMAAGASHLGFFSYLAGTALGMVWGLAALTLFGSELMDAILDPGPGSFAVLGVVLAVIAISGILLRRRLRRLSGRSGADDSTDPTPRQSP